MKQVDRVKMKTKMMFVYFPRSVFKFICSRYVLGSQGSTMPVLSETFQKSDGSREPFEIYPQCEEKVLSLSTSPDSTRWGQLHPGLWTVQHSCQIQRPRATFNDRMQVS